MILHASSQHSSQVGQSHSMSPAGIRGWAVPQRVRMGLPSRTLRSRRAIAWRCPASGNHTKGLSEYSAGTALNTNDNCVTPSVCGGTLRMMINGAGYVSYPHWFLRSDAYSVAERVHVIS
jgi:hypothetical protein